MSGIIKTIVGGHLCPPTNFFYFSYTNNSITPNIINKIPDKKLENLLINFPIILFPTITPTDKRSILNINVQINENNMFIPVVLAIIPVPSIINC